MNISVTLAEFEIALTYFWSIASMNCPITSGTLCIRLISSCARTSSIFRLLDIGQPIRTYSQNRYQIPLLVLDVFFLKLNIPRMRKLLSTGCPFNRTHSRCRWSFFSVEYSSLPSVPRPSNESMFGIDDGICFLWGNTWFIEFSTSTSPMVNGIR
jgi:hypothetical protein